MIGTLYQRVCPDCEGLFGYTPRPDGGGVSPRCDPCRAAHKARGNTRRSAVWREANREKSRQYMQAYQANRRLDPEERAKDAAYLRERYAENPDYNRARAGRWAKNNPEKACAATRRRTARKAAAEGAFTPEEFATVCKQHNHSCFYCGKKTKLVAEHMTPLSRGGSNWITNIVPACRPCNSSKGSMTTEEYMMRKGDRLWLR
jgi:5-methylcytosine-specific restriction endonuclease McrA